MDWMDGDWLERYKKVAEDLVSYLHDRSIKSFVCHSYESERPLFSDEKVKLQDVNKVIDDFYIRKRYSAIYFDVAIDLRCVEEVLDAMIDGWKKGDMWVNTAENPPSFEYAEKQFLDKISEMLKKSVLKHSLSLHEKDFFSSHLSLMTYYLRRR